MIIALAIFGTTVWHSVVGAPKYDYNFADELVITDGFISSLANKKGIDVNNPKWLIGELVVKYGIDYEEFYKTIQCESNFRHEGVFGDNKKAYGILQFHEKTFNQYCQGDWKNMEDQLECGAKMFSQGLQKHWTCAKI